MPELMRPTTLRWSLVVAGLFAGQVVALVSFVYLKVAVGLTLNARARRRLAEVNERVQRIVAGNLRERPMGYQRVDRSGGAGSRTAWAIGLAEDWPILRDSGRRWDL
jgi:hypothetical protein